MSRLCHGRGHGFLAPAARPPPSAPKASIARPRRIPPIRPRPCSRGSAVLAAWMVPLQRPPPSSLAITPPLANQLTGRRVFRGAATLLAHPPNSSRRVRRSSLFQIKASTGLHLSTISVRCPVRGVRSSAYSAPTAAFNLQPWTLTRTPPPFSPILSFLSSRRPNKSPTAHGPPLTDRRKIMGMGGWSQMNPD